MVEVDPMLLIAAGSIAAGLAAAALCLRAPSKQAVRNTTSSKKAEDSVAAKPKKRASKAAKKATPGSANDSAADSESEIAALLADIGPITVQKKIAKKGKEATKASGPSSVEVAAAKAAQRKLEDAAEAAARKAEAAEEAAELEAALLAEEEEAKKSKKAKESPAQKLARLERQRLAKVKKTEEDELSKSAAIQLAAAESKILSAAAKSGASAQSAHVDGWAVVEDKRKTKAKAAPVPVASEAPATDLGGPVDAVRSDITVESKKIGIIIGPKGATLHGIQDATGVEIQTPKGERDTSNASVIITVTGTADGVARATKAINELCTKGYTKLLAGEDFKEGSIDVHPSSLSEIIGKGGANIRSIQDFTGVKLSIPQVARDHNTNVKITVAGNKDKVAIAKSLILELTTYYHTAVTHPGHIHVEMDVPSALYNYIIGARGSEIKHIQGNFKVSVHIPNADSISPHVVIAGEPVGVKGAEKYIQKIIDQAVVDREAAEKMADSWVDTEVDAGHEEWMDEYTHPSSRAAIGSETMAGGGNGASAVDVGGLQMSSASATASSTSGGAWGASVLASADGW